MTGMIFYRFKRVVVLLLMCGLASVVSAQLSDRADLETVSDSYGIGVKPVASPFSLLDCSRIRWSHSYSVSFFSGGNASGSAGLLRTTMFYDLSPKLSLSFNLGIAHTGGILSAGNEATLLPGFMLDYHPSDKFRLTFMVQHFGGISNPYEYRSRFWHNPLGP